MTVTRKHAGPFYRGTLAERDLVSPPWPDNAKWYDGETIYWFDGFIWHPYTTVQTGTDEPSPTYPGLIWIDGDIIRVRNEDDSAWIDFTEAGFADPTTDLGDMIVRGQSSQVTQKTDVAKPSLGADVTVSSEVGDCHNNLIDEVDMKLYTYWFSANPMVDEWIVIDLGASKTISAYNLQQNRSGSRYALQFTIETSENGTDWTPAETIDYDYAYELTKYTVNEAGDRGFDFTAPHTGRYWRFTCTDYPGGEEDLWQVGQIQLYEDTVEIFTEVQRLPVGTEGQMLQSKDGVPTWGTKITVGTTEPTSPAEGDLWIDTN